MIFANKEISHILSIHELFQHILMIIKKEKTII